MDAKELGKRIRARRKALKLRHMDVAEASGVSLSMLSMVERGSRTPTMATLQRIATALQTTPSALLAWDMAQEMGGATESLVAYLNGKHATPEQVRRVESLARVLLEVDQGVRVPAIPLPAEKKAKALEAIATLRERTQKPPDWCWLCRGDPAAQCPECGAPPVPISFVLPAAKADDAENRAWVSTWDAAKEAP